MNPKLIPFFSQEKLKELFEYKNGKLFWKIKGNGIRIGKHAGWINREGYRDIQINGKNYGEHRLIFLLFYGYFPKEIDHINGNPSDNRIENLRKVTRSQNQMNKKKVIHKSSKYKGVSWDKQAQKWKVRITKNGIVKQLGRYDNEIEAGKVYNQFAEKYFGEYKHINKF